MSMGLNPMGLTKFGGDPRIIAPFAEEAMFRLTADVGANLSYRIWRFCLNLNPELHYIITNSYNIYSKPDKGAAEARPQRWQFSFMFSFGLKL